ncbi:MAG: phosphotransferase [bacterium]
MPSAPELERLGSGRAAEVFAFGPGKIIKLLREPGGHDYLQREAAAQAAARAAGIAAPEVFGIEQVEGRTGIVMERINGLDGLSAIDKKPWRVWAIGRDVGSLHRQLSTVPAPEGLRSAKEYMLGRVTASPRVPPSAVPRILDVVAALPEGDRLCHFDFHPGNVIESPAGPVVIDFANAMNGDPMADHARSLMTFEAGEPADDTGRKERILIAVGRGLAKLAYKSGYGPVDADRLKRWRPLVIAARLDEGVPEERTRLLRMLSRSLRDAED